MPGKHALLSPSSAYRWMECPGSVAMSRGLPDTTSEAAEEGTYAHLCASELLSGRPAPASDKWDRAEVVRSLEPYITYANSLTGKKYVEQELDIGHITGEKGAKGTTDLLNIDGDRLTELDLKFGTGLRIDAVDNPQLAIYALAALDAYGHPGIKTVKMVIVQPRLDWIDEWELTVEELNELRQEIAEKAKAAREQLSADKPCLNPGISQCRFCKASGICKAQADFAMKAASQKLIPIAGCLMSRTELGKAYEALPAIKAFIKGVEEQVCAALNSGETIPGWKLVQGKPGPRKWADAAEAKAFFRSKRIPCCQMTVKTPAQMEKQLKGRKDGKNLFEQLSDLIVRSAGSPAIVPESDPRPAAFRIADVPVLTR